MRPHVLLLCPDSDHGASCVSVHTHSFIFFISLIGTIPPSFLFALASPPPPHPSPANRILFSDTVVPSSAVHASSCALVIQSFERTGSAGGHQSHSHAALLSCGASTECVHRRHPGGHSRRCWIPASRRPRPQARTAARLSGKNPMTDPMCM